MDTFKVTAPTRADLAGGTLDLWPIYNYVEGGKTINVALDIHAVAHFEVHPASAFRMEVTSFNDETHSFDVPLRLDEAKRLSPAVQFPVAVASMFLRQRGALPAKLIRMKVESQAPLRSGLGGSSSLCVAMLRGLARVFDDFTEQGWQWRVLDWVKDAEAAFLRTPTGTQDYLAALFGGLKCYDFQVGKIEVNGYPDATTKGLADRMLVLFSGEMHHSGVSNWEVFKGANEGHTDILGGFSAIKRIAEELDVDLRAEVPNWKRIGLWLNEEWEIRKAIFKVQTPRLEEIIAFLDKQKILGRKVCGAAAGGSLLILAEPERKAEVARACEAAGFQILKASPVSSGALIK